MGNFHFFIKVFYKVYLKDNKLPKIPETIGHEIKTFFFNGGVFYTTIFL